MILVIQLTKLTITQKKNNEMEKKITDHDHDKFNRLTSDDFAARLA